jgi:hypothetical protein
MTNPWTTPDFVVMTFTPDGHYSAQCAGEHGAPCLAFYYGDDVDSPYKIFALTDVTADGDGSGWLDIFWLCHADPADTTRGSLEYVRVSDDLTRLQFEFWATWSGRYGPIAYDLHCTP